MCSRCQTTSSRDERPMTRRITCCRGAMRGPVSSVIGVKGLQRPAFPYTVRYQPHHWTSSIEAQRRFAVPRVLVADGSNVVAKSLANKVGAIVKYAGIKPEFITPAAMSADVYASKSEWRRLALQRYGLNEQQTSGGKPLGLNSGTALMTQNQIEDARRVKLAARRRTAARRRLQHHAAPHVRTQTHSHRAGLAQGAAELG